MKCFRSAAALSVVAALTAMCGRGGEAEWRPLFDPGLSNAVFDPSVWRRDADGCLTAAKDVAIWTRDEYARFELSCEYCLEPAANSGILIYCSDKDNWVPNAVEIQLIDNDAPKWKGLDPRQANLSFFGHQAPKSNPAKPAGEWNSIVVRADGPRLTVSLNGEVVNECDLSAWTDAVKLPDGSAIPPWLSRPWADLETTGRIGLQGRHAGAGVRFRNVRIRPLPSSRQVRRLMSYNVRMGCGHDDPFSLPKGSLGYLPKVADVIKRFAPDVCGIQEIDKKSARAGGMDQTAELAKLCGMEGSWVEKNPGYGVAMLFRERPFRVFSVLMPGSLHTRALMIAEYPGYVVANTHFPLSESTCENAARIVCSVLSREARGRPVFLMGDLNSVPGSPAMRVLGESFVSLSDTTAHTWPAKKPDRTIDYVMVDSAHASRFGDAESRVIAEPAATDHAAVVVDLPAGAASGCAAFAPASSTPHWIDILPLTDSFSDENVADAAFLGNETISDGIAWSCTLVPEGDPAVDKASVYAERFSRIAPRVRARSNVRQGFLIQATIGHGWTPGLATPWQKVVWADGSTTYRFCPLGADFRRHVGKQLRTLAAAKPEFFLADDDTKLLGPRVDGCFCPLHLAGFAEKSGRFWPREELVAAIEKGDRALAAAWRDYSESTVVDYARFIRAAFHETIPGVLCVTMGPINRLGYVVPSARALAGTGFRPVVRLSSAPYWSDGLYDILAVRRYAAYQMSYLLPETDVLVEADTCPQVRWQTSATRALDHMTMLVAEGCCGAKMWWHRMGNPHERRSSAAYLRAFSGRTGALRWLASAGFTASGVWCPAGEKAVEWGESVFGMTGIPYHYGPRAAGDVAALTADSSASLDGAALTNLLSGPVILDGSAAIALTRRGFGDLIGVRAKAWSGPSVSYEDFGGVKQTSSTGANPADLSDRLPGTEETTRLFNRVSPMSEDSAYLAPGSLWHKNSLGGRVATLAARVPKPPFTLAEFGYCNETRKGLLVKTLARLANELPGGVVYLGDEAVLCEAGRTGQGESVVIVDSLDLDVIENPEFAFAATPSSIERLTDDGRWESVSMQTSAAGTTILATALAPHRPAVFRVVKMNIATCQ